MTDAEQTPGRTPHVAAPQSPRISRRDKRRNRRRKSKYARPLVSVAHGLVLLMFVFAAVFVAAIGQGLIQASDLALRSVDTQQLSDLGLPGAAEPARRRAATGPVQIGIWLYLFGTPAVFAALRGFYWRRTMSGAQYFAYTGMAVWSVVILVIIVTAVMRP